MSSSMMPPPPPPLPRPSTEQNLESIVVASNLVHHNETKAKELWFLLSRARLYAFEEGIITRETATRLATDYLFESPYTPEERVEFRAHTVETIIQESKDFWWYVMHCVVKPLVSEWMNDSDARWAYYKNQPEYNRLNYFSTKLTETKTNGRCYDFTFAKNTMDSIIAVDWTYANVEYMDPSSRYIKAAMKTYFENKLILLAELCYQWTKLKPDTDVEKPNPGEWEKTHMIFDKLCKKLGEIKHSPRMRAIDLPIEKWPCYNTHLFERDVDMVNAISDNFLLPPGHLRQQDFTDEAKRNLAEWEKAEAEEIQKQEAAKQMEFKRIAETLKRKREAGTGSGVEANSEAAFDGDMQNAKCK